MKKDKDGESTSKKSKFKKCPKCGTESIMFRCPQCKTSLV